MELKIRSIFTTIILWCVATVGLSLVGYVMTSVLLSARYSGRDSYIPRFNALFLDDARRTFEDGGSTKLAEYLTRLERYADAQYYLTDARGIDLVSGEDRSDLLAHGTENRRSRVWRLPLMRSSQSIRVHRSRDRSYRLIAVVPPRFDPWVSLWYFLWLPVLMALLCYLLAVHLATPLRGM